MHLIQKIIKRLKLNKQEKEEERQLKELKRILDQELPLAYIVKGENYLNKCEYFLMEFSPMAIANMIKDGIETSCKFIQLTGEDAGEMFSIPKPCFLSQQKNKIPAYFLLNNSENLSVAVNAYGNYDIDTNLNEDDLSRTVTLRDLIVMRDDDNQFMDCNSIDFNNDKFVTNLTKLKDCSKMIKRAHNEISYSKS